jgi:hypothetical protein
VERELGVKVNVKEAFKINKDKMTLAKIESWERKKNKKDERLYTYR